MLNYFYFAFFSISLSLPLLVSFGSIVLALIPLADPPRCKDTPTNWVLALIYYIDVVRNRDFFFLYFLLLTSYFEFSFAWGQSFFSMKKKFPFDSSLSFSSTGLKLWRRRLRCLSLEIGANNR